MGAKKAILKTWVLVALAFWALPLVALPTLASDLTAEEFVASSVNQCGSEDIGGKQMTPRNCLFLDEPIGGKPNYDLYTVTCTNGKCTTTLWGGGQILPEVRGPIQAVLTSQAGKEYQGPFGLLYNYLSLIYTYMSGLIIGISVLFVVIGGIQIATSGGETTGRTAGINRIKQAITGVILWFTASLILYTINPTFFTISQS